MISLRPDYLAFKSTAGEFIPCTAEQVVIELIGEAVQWLDKDIITNAAQAVLHYFRKEKGQDTVSFGEFVEALERVLKGLGLDLKAKANTAAPWAVTMTSTSPGGPSPRRVIETDLSELAGESAGGAELFFFPRLRHEVHRRLDGTPLVLLFRGLRACVKQVVGVKRWNSACQSMNDQIVEYLRTCLNAEEARRDCGLVVV